MGPTGAENWDIGSWVLEKRRFWNQSERFHFGYRFNPIPQTNSLATQLNGKFAPNLSIFNEKKIKISKQRILLIIEFSVWLIY